VQMQLGVQIMGAAHWGSWGRVAQRTTAAHLRGAAGGLCKKWLRSRGRLL
jgi:hypothetical protein